MHLHVSVKVNAPALIARLRSSRRRAKHPKIRHAARIRHGAVTAVSLMPGGEHTQAFGSFSGIVRGRRSRVVPTPGVLASRLAAMRRPTGAHIDQPQGDGGNSATLPEEPTKDTVKTIRAGKAGRPAHLWSTPCAFLRPRTCGCRRRPAFPAPFGNHGAQDGSTTRAKRAARSRRCVWDERG
jgi:hypothetical protein